MLRFTGVVGLISFADNLKNWRELFSRIAAFFDSIDWLAFAVTSFDLLTAVYDQIKGLVFGWIQDEMLRDSAMLASSIAGIFLVEQFIRNRRPARSITIFMLAVTAIYLVGHYPFDIFGPCSDEGLFLLFIFAPPLFMITAQLVKNLYTTPGALKPGAAPMSLHEKLFWGFIPIIAVVTFITFLGFDLIGQVRLPHSSEDCS